MRLSTHFTLSEMVASQTATRLGIPNRPDDLVVANLERTALRLEAIRAGMGGAPIYISSGYRCPELNRIIGGSEDSRHLYGLAVDFVAPGYGQPEMICRAIEGSGFEFDQLIYEGGWVHLAIEASGESPRRSVLTASFNRGRAAYTVGIIS